MNIKIVKNYEKIVEKAVDIVEKKIGKNNINTLGLATGKTFLGFYDKLVKKHINENLSFEQVETFNLDEYVDLPPKHKQSFNYYMEKNFFQYVNIPEENHHLPDGTAENLHKECKRYEEKIKKSGGIDIQFLGIGKNGHIGYNEPESPFDSRTRVVELSEKTRENKKELFKNTNEAPTKAITMGIGTILESDEIILLANGGEKSAAIKRAVEGPVKTQVPASALQKHGKTTLIIDEKAGDKLKN